MNYSKPSTKLLIAGCLSLVVAFASLNRANANTDPSKSKKKEINSPTTHIYFDIDEKRVHEVCDGFIFERFAFHHMAPVAG